MLDNEWITGNLQFKDDIFLGVRIFAGLSFLIRATHSVPRSESSCHAVHGTNK